MSEPDQPLPSIQPADPPREALRSLERHAAANASSAFSILALCVTILTLAAGVVFLFVHLPGWKSLLTVALTCGVWSYLCGLAGRRIRKLTTLSPAGVSALLCPELPVPDPGPLGQPDEP